MRIKKENKVLNGILFVALAMLFAWIFYTCIFSPDPFYEAKQSNGHTYSYNRAMGIECEK